MRDFRASRFDDALDALTIAAKYDPQSVRVAQLKTAVEQAHHYGHTRLEAALH